MSFTSRKQQQRSGLLAMQSIFSQGMSILEIGVGDGSFAAHLQTHYGYKMIGYDIQRLFNKKYTIDRYYVGGRDILQKVFAQNPIDGILIAYTLHHMTNEQITSLLENLLNQHKSILILEETYTRSSLLVRCNDIVSNLFQYGIWAFNRKEYFQLNFKTDTQRQQFFTSLGFHVAILGKTYRYGYLRTTLFHLISTT